jgi:hypothetical protein
VLDEIDEDRKFQVGEMYKTRGGDLAECIKYDTSFGMTTVEFRIENKTTRRWLDGSYYTDLGRPHPNDVIPLPVKHIIPT